MVFFETYLLCSYNLQIGQRLLVDCPCYEMYVGEENFRDRVINQRQSYMGCIAYESQTRKRTGHRSVPVMLGSYIDCLIRGFDAVENSRAHWGTFVLNGMLKINSSFSTFNALSLHVRQCGGNKTIEWFTYVNGEGLAISYRNKTVEWTFRRDTFVDYDSDGWVTLLNEANPFIRERRVLGSEYIDLFNCILEYPYDMNDLKNRQFLNSATIINKYIDFDLSKRKKKKGVGCMKMSSAFEQGAMYIVLSKKIYMHQTEEWNKNYPQSYDSTLHDGRSNKTAYYLQNVTRASNDAVRNSRALVYPCDAFGYYCPLNTKDLKSAGEQNVLADYVMMTEDSDQMELYEYIRDRASAATTKKGVYGDGEEDLVRLLINDFFTDCSVVWNLKTLLDIKRKFPHVTSKYYRPYVLLYTKASIPIKYHDGYDECFSPAESTQYQIVYPERSNLSLIAKCLDPSGVRKTLAAKSTVAINNIKGSVANLQNKFHYDAMRMSLGTTCYIDIDAEEKARILDLAVLEPIGSNDTSAFLDAYARIDATFNLTEQMARDADDEERNDTRVREAMDKLVNRMYDQDKLLVEYRRGIGTPYTQERRPDSRARVTKYVQTVFGAKHFNAPDVWNLRLWAVFGNKNGICVEDGVGLDKKTVAQIPNIVYNACITVDFTFATTKKPQFAQFVTINDKTRSGVGANETLIGCLLSEFPVFVKNSKHCQVVCGTIGNHYYYLLHFLPKRTNTYDDLNVTHIRNGKVITVVITGVHRASVGVGTKLANPFGQKNVCSCVLDLSDYWGITRDGRKVHAQILYSNVSIVGRTASGQIYNALTSPDLAIGPNGVFLAPVNLVIHTLHPYTNVKEFGMKVDTLTNVNGFDSQCLGGVSHAIRTHKDPLLDKVRQAIGLHGYNVRLLDIEEQKLIDRRMIFRVNAGNNNDDDDDDDEDEREETDDNNESGDYNENRNNDGGGDDDDDDNCNNDTITRKRSFDLMLNGSRDRDKKRYKKCVETPSSITRKRSFDQNAAKKKY